MKDLLAFLFSLLHCFVSAFRDLQAGLARDVPAQRCFTIHLVFALGATVGADSDRSEACRARLENDRGRIDRDASRFGEHSHQVDHDVNRMNEDRQWCKEHKADWDHSCFDVGIYFRP
jgi:hypothetical protein